MRKIGVAISGALLLGSTLVGAVGAATDVNKDFFINPSDGEPTCLIVVGSNAAAEDVVSASWISAQIGSMAYYTEETANQNTYSVIYDEEAEVDNYMPGSSDFSIDAYFDDFRIHGDTLGTPESWVVLPYVCSGAGTLTDPFSASAYDGTFYEDKVLEPWWDYDIYIDHNTNFGCTAEVMVDTGCSYESVTVDFSIRDQTCTQDLCVTCAAACDQEGLWEVDIDGEGTGANIVGPFVNPDPITYNVSWIPIDPVTALDECQTYPNIYPRHYWGTPAWNDEVCDPVGGMEYRTIVTGIDSLTTVTWNAIIGPDSEAYGICEPIAPTAINLYCDTCDVYFLGDHYDAISFGTNVDGVDYMFYGTPKWFIEEKLHVGESKEYGGYTLTINDLGIYENKAYITITDPSGESYDYITVINTYTSQVPSDGDGDADNEENSVIAFKEDTCGTSEVVFAVNFVKTLIGASGSYVVEYHAYTLEDYGCIKERIYPGPCDTYTSELYMPYVVSNCGGENLDWYLDIIPNNEIGVKDLDNALALWSTGNPNFDAADKLNIYDPFDYAASGFPAIGTTEYYALTAILKDYYVATYDSVNTRWTLTLANGLTQPYCRPALELWLATPVELAGMCSDALTVCLDDMDGNNYFTLKVVDAIHTDYRIDGDITFSKIEKLAPIITTEYVDIDPTKLVKLDIGVEAEPDLKSEYNLVLIGGPVANSIVQELVDLGITTFEEWDTSEGEYKLYEDVYSLGKDVLVVAGADRTGTSKAALDLITDLS